MTEDKGQNQVVIDWLVNSEAEGTFLTGPDGILEYVEIRALSDVERTGDVSWLVPTPSAASVREIFSGVASGPVVVSSAVQSTRFELPDSVMTLLFTSGTTGAPKLVPLSITNWKAAVSASAEHLDHTSDDVWLLAMPLHHVGGLSILFRSAYVGASVRMLAAFDPTTFADALSNNVTMASVVPTMLRRVLDLDRRPYEGLRAVLVGGGPIPSGLLEEAHERGIPALPTYGMTETCAQVATLRPGSGPKYRADILPGMEARSSSDGRIELRGDQVFDGYLGEPAREATGWFTTGDLGRVTNGSLEILGRADDLIISGGENVDPSRVEVCLLGAGDVESAMVIGVPSETWGQSVVALYVGDASDEALADHARKSLDPHEVPKRFVRVEALPMTSMGKPDRSAGVAILRDISPQ